MTASDQSSESDPESSDCEAEVLFGLIWASLVDLLGSAATATLIRRSLKRAAMRAPALAHVKVEREQFEYRYVLPAEWNDETSSLDGLRELARELSPLLAELTGPVALQRLRGIEDLRKSRVFFSEDEP